jgi:hypothetical protein
VTSGTTSPYPNGPGADGSIGARSIASGHGRSRGRHPSVVFDRPPHGEREATACDEPPPQPTSAMRTAAVSASASMRGPFSHGRRRNVCIRGVPYASHR